jgi:hypothetical protein
MIIEFDPGAEPPQAILVWAIAFALPLVLWTSMGLKQ